MSNNYYVYTYFDPLTMVPFYVGKGKKNRWKPKNHHHRTQPYLVNKIRKIGLENIIIDIIGTFTNIEACEKEKQLIQLYGRKDQNNGPLLNLTNGGDGNDGWHQRPETVEKRRKTMIQKFADGKYIPPKPWLGKTRSKEDRKKISETLTGQVGPMLGKTHSEKSKRKMSISAKARKPMTVAHRAILSKAVQQWWDSRRKKNE